MGEDPNSGLGDSETLLRELLGAEQIKLRAELAHLKDCQLRYYSLSVAATGVLVSVGSRLPGVPDHFPVYYLAPLLIVVPCWWIFFDKATTITRIVGYLRLIDDFFRHTLKADALGPQYLGWETALQVRRGDRRSNRPATPREWRKAYKTARTKVLFLRTTHRYWGFTWYTFFLLSVACLLLGWLASRPVFSDTFAYVVLVISSGIVFITTAYNLYLVGDLTEGRRSYEENYKAWCRIHRKAADWRDEWESKKYAPGSNSGDE